MLRVLFLPIVGLAGVGASYAMADGGHGHHQGQQSGPNASCQRTHLLGALGAPQTLTVTVSKSDPGSPFVAGQVVTVSIGSTGQTVRVNLEGCGNGSSLTANQADLHAAPPPAGNGPANEAELHAPPPPAGGNTPDGHGHHGHQGDGDHQTNGQTTGTTTVSTGDGQQTTQSTTTTTAATPTTTTGR